MTIGSIVDLMDPVLNIEGTLVDGLDIAIPKAGVLTFTLSLFNESDLAAINSRTDQDIRDTNGGTLGDPATFVMRLDPADAIIVDPLGTAARGDVESHIVRFTWTWNDGTATRTGIQEIRLRVQKTTA